MENPDSATYISTFEDDQYDWNNRVVLITEDEEVNFFYLKTLLKKTDAHIIRAKNGKEAVEIIAEHYDVIDVILMDLNMPVMDGYEAMRIIKSRHPEIPIIAQTATALTDTRRICLQAGFNGYISKPISSMALLRMVNENLS